MRDPILSVIVPAYDAEQYLADALESVRGQAPEAAEIIVVDDGSTDGTAAVARRFPEVRYLHQPNGGPAAARNRGLDAARGALLAFLDADDLWSASKLRVQLPRLDDDPGLDAVSGYVGFLTPSPHVESAPRFAPWGTPRVLPSFGSLVARRRVFETVGPLDESLRCGEDVDWFMRAREHGVRIATVDEVVLHYRLHGANLTRGRVPQDVGYARAVKKLLDRRRERASRARGEGASATPCRRFERT